MVHEWGRVQGAGDHTGGGWQGHPRTAAGNTLSKPRPVSLDVNLWHSLYIYYSLKLPIEIRYWSIYPICVLEAIVNLLFSLFLFIFIYAYYTGYNLSCLYDYWYIWIWLSQVHFICNPLCNFRSFADNVGPIKSAASQKGGMSAQQLVQEILSQAGRC